MRRRPVFQTDDLFDDVEPIHKHVGPRLVCNNHVPRTGPVNGDGVIVNKWRCPNCGGKVSKSKYRSGITFIE